MVKPGVLAGALGAVLSSIAGFLSDFILILIIMLFLLAEGPAMLNRLRASSDHPQVAILTTVGQAVVLQFGLRAIVNLVTGAGVTTLLFVLGVDFPLLWGILTFAYLAAQEDAEPFERKMHRLVASCASSRPRGPAPRRRHRSQPRDPGLRY